MNLRKLVAIPSKSGLHFHVSRTGRSVVIFQEPSQSPLNRGFIFTFGRALWCRLPERRYSRNPL